MQSRTLMTLAVTAALAALAVGCSDSVSEPKAGAGTMRVSLIDAPGDYDAVNLEVIAVRVHRDEAGIQDGGPDMMSGWTTISSDTTYVDLLTLTNGNHTVLADSTLPAGHYTQVRLLLGDGNTVVVDGETFDLDVPSGSQSGLKLNHPFDIEDGMVYSVTLDFDADRSIHRTGAGQYKLKPVMRLMVDGISGSISGTVEPVESRALVLALSDGDTVITYADTLTGNFRFPMLTAGSYDLELSATAGAYRDSTLTGVVVTARQNTDLGTVVLEAE